MYCTLYCTYQKCIALCIAPAEKCIALCIAPAQKTYCTLYCTCQKTYCTLYCTCQKTYCTLYCTFGSVTATAKPQSSVLPSFDKCVTSRPYALYRKTRAFYKSSEAFFGRYTVPRGTPTPPRKQVENLRSEIYENKLPSYSIPTEYINR